MAKNSETELVLIGERIRECRTKQNMSQAVLAEKADLSLPQISAIEHGKAVMRITTFIRIVEALQVSSDELLGANTPSIRATYQSELVKLIEGCSPAELNTIKRVIVDIKAAMRTNRED